MRISSSLLARQPTELLRFSHGGNRRGSRPDPLRRIAVIPKASFPEDPRCSHLTTSVPGTPHRYLQRTPSERQVRTAASSCERISPHHRVTRPQSLCLGKAIQSQSRVHLCNAVVRVRHQRPATPAQAGQSSSFSLLPHRALLCSPLCSKTANASNLQRPSRQCLTGCLPLGTDPTLSFVLGFNVIQDRAALSRVD